MTAIRKVTESWLAIGTSKTSPTENKTRAQASLDSYYVVIGFEVNKPEAFVDDIHDLAKDYGHAFFYLVKNISIKCAFSFGPAGIGKVGLLNRGRTMTSIKNGANNARPATADYGITELVKAFKIPVTKKQAESLEQEVKSLRIEIYYDKVKYSALVNDTCAETAKEVLDNADVETPGGSGWIKHSDKMSVSVAYAVNPYKWHKNFKKEYSETNFKPDVMGEWIPVVGEDDPIFGAAGANKAAPVSGAGR